MYKIYNNSLEYSGNTTTLNRLNKILLSINGKNYFTNKIEDKLIGIHAYKFGKLVYDKNIDYILIIGGTDLNEDVNDNNKKKIIIKSIENAKYIICFNNFLFNKVKFLCPKIDNKIKIIPQSIQGFPINKEFNLMQIIKDKTGKEYEKIYAIVGNIRSVKDPFYLENIFNSKLKNHLLILLGRVIEDGLIINETNNFIKLDPIDSIYLKSFYSQIDGLINCSKSEGMSGSILEAMFYSCPVYARNIEGNIALIKDQVTGYIFSEPEEIIKLFEKSVDNIVINAREYVLENHSFKLEEDLYKNSILIIMYSDKSEIYNLNYYKNVFYVSAHGQSDERQFVVPRGYNFIQLQDFGFRLENTIVKSIYNFFKREEITPYLNYIINWSTPEACRFNDPEKRQSLLNDMNHIGVPFRFFPYRSTEEKPPKIFKTLSSR